MRRKHFVLLAVILALGAFFRFYDLKEIPPGLYPDEAMNGNNALEALATGHFKVFYTENNGREGLFINIQAISIKLFGNRPWALRGVSALFGTLTILGIYLAAKELFGSYEPQAADREKEDSSDRNSKFALRNSASIALLASFFLATSYWHLNFSRIGFRAIMLPFVSCFALYFLLKGFRKGTISDIALAGIFTGLGFYTYIAFRFMPFVLAVPILGYLWRWRERNKKSNLKNQNDDPKFKNLKCVPCALALFLFVTFATALPIGYYFLNHPEDFTGRTGQVSVFSSAHPIKEFAVTNIKTLGMLLVWGDCNWRHNFPCQPELHPIAAVFFLIGIVIILREVVFNKKPDREKEDSSDRNSEFTLRNSTLLAWLIFMSFPATLTTEGLPHALRSIGMIPAAMIIAAYGAWEALCAIQGWLEQKKKTFSEISRKISRIQAEISVLFFGILLLSPLTAYYTYFHLWTQKLQTYSAFATDVLHMGEYANTLPPDTLKYAVTEVPLPRLREVGTPAQTVMFISNTYLEKDAEVKNMHYLTADEIKTGLPSPLPQRTMIMFFNGHDTALIRELQTKFPELKPFAPRDFVILKNY